jgi:2,3-bisphosphoglycerate-dependent phosphoglycerate mutase
MSRLVLIRHGQSTWNAQNRFTGWVDVPLSPLGRNEAKYAALILAENRQSFHVCFTSLLIRAIETAVICLTEGEGICAGRSPVIKHGADDPCWNGWDKYDGDPDQELPIFTAQALDERYYGELQGFNKQEMAERVGKEQVQIWRRSFDTRPPGGESLADTAARTLPFFESRIMDHMRAGHDVLVSAHGNSLRSIIMKLDNLSEEEVPLLELATGIPILYEFEGDRVLSKTILTADRGAEA